MLSLELGELGELGFDLDLTGFGEEELKKASLEEEQEPERIEDNKQLLLMLTFDDEAELQRAFDVCQEKGWPCKIIE